MVLWNYGDTTQMLRNFLIEYCKCNNICIKVQAYTSTEMVHDIAISIAIYVKVILANGQNLKLAVNMPGS